MSTEVERVAKEELSIEVGQTLYVISDYDNSIIKARVKSISKSFNEKWFVRRVHNYIVVKVSYIESKAEYTVCFYPKDFNKSIFNNREDAERVTNNTCIGGNKDV